MVLRWWCDPTCSLQSPSVWESIGRCEVRYKLARSCHSPPVTSSSLDWLELATLWGEGRCKGEKQLKGLWFFLLWLNMNHNLCVLGAERNLYFPLLFSLSLLCAHLSVSIHHFTYILSFSAQFLPLLSSNKPANFRVIFPSSVLCLTLWHIISLAVCTTLFSTNYCTDGRGKAQMGSGQFFIGCSIPQRPTHLVCSEKHLCTNLFVTIHWRDYLSSCHALVAAWCLKNMASHKFQAARLAGRLGLTHTSHLTVGKKRREGRNGKQRRKGKSEEYKRSAEIIFLNLQHPRIGDKIIHFHFQVSQKRA